MAALLITSMLMLVAGVLGLWALRRAEQAAMVVARVEPDPLRAQLRELADERARLRQVFDDRDAR